MSSLSTLPNGDSAWLLRKAIERIMQQVSVLETNIGSSTTGNSSNTQVIFNDNGTLRGDAGLTYNATTDTLTVGAATITGNLTVDTNTLFVDAANNRVGIGTVSPADFIHALAPAGGGNMLLEGTAGNFPQFISKVGAKTWSSGYRSGTTSFELWEDSSQRYTIGNGGTPHTWYIGASTAMTLNSTGLGVGVTPSAWGGGGRAFEIGFIGTGIQSRNNQYSAFTQNSWFNSSAQWIYGATGLASRYDQDAGTHKWFIAPSGTAGNAITFTQAMTLDSSGNLGVGGSPQAKIHAIDSGGVCALFTRAAAPSAALSAVYIQAPVSSGFSSTPVLNFWFQNTGISNPASETLSIRTSNAERIRYGSDGNAYHSLQGTVPTIPNNGEMVFNFTSNTNLRISARGSDGTTRVANITLA